MPDQPYLHTDSLSWIMMALISFMGVTLASFSHRYLDGDNKKSLFLKHLLGLTLSLILLVNANDIFLFIAAWGLSNLIFTRLILHKGGWLAAKNAGVLARKSLMLGTLAMGLGLFILAWTAGSTSLQVILHADLSALGLYPGILFIILGAMMQAGLWPMHKWLLSSLNAPTPASAMMHAGLVNGGGFLLFRMAPVLEPLLLSIFFIGIVSAILGATWKLCQPDIKRMLTCSTISQMGFMTAQVGLGLYPAALAHLCCHGLFKAALFLNAGSAGKMPKLKVHTAPSGRAFSLALLSGLVGAIAFMLVSGKSFAANTNLFLVGIALIAGTQLALVMLQEKGLKQLLPALVVTSIAGSVYGGTVALFEVLLGSDLSVNPQPLTLVHGFAFVALALCWAGILFKEQLINHPKLKQHYLQQYVRAINASQAQSNTITHHRNQYKS